MLQRTVSVLQLAGCCCCCCRELALLGLRVKQITADGNCFFRALSDQLEVGALLRGRRGHAQQQGSSRCMHPACTAAGQLAAGQTVPSRATCLQWLPATKLRQIRNCNQASLCPLCDMLRALQGNEHQHSTLRARVVGLMQQREPDFAPFVEDDQSFAGYIARMKKVRRRHTRQQQQRQHYNWTVCFTVAAAWGRAAHQAAGHACAASCR